MAQPNRTIVLTNKKIGQGEQNATSTLSTSSSTAASRQSSKKKNTLSLFRRKPGNDNDEQSKKFSRRHNWFYIHQDRVHGPRGSTATSHLEEDYYYYYFRDDFDEDDISQISDDDDGVLDDFDDINDDNDDVSSSSSASSISASSSSSSSSSSLANSNSKDSTIFSSILSTAVTTIRKHSSKLTSNINKNSKNNARKNDFKKRRSSVLNRHQHQADDDSTSSSSSSDGDGSDGSTSSYNSIISEKSDTSFQTHRIHIFRNVVVLIYLHIALGLVIICALKSRGAQIQKFKDHFEVIASTAMEHFQGAIIDHYRVLEGISLSITSLVLHTTPHKIHQWPFVHIPESMLWTPLGDESEVIGFTPLITNATKEEWEEFSHSLLSKPLLPKVQPIHPIPTIQYGEALDDEGDDYDYYYNDDNYDYDVDDDDTISQWQQPHYHVPIWQEIPKPTIADINFDLMSQEPTRSALMASLDTQTAVMSDFIQVIPGTDDTPPVRMALHAQTPLQKTSSIQIRSTLYYPILNTPDDIASKSASFSSSTSFDIRDKLKKLNNIINNSNNNNHRNDDSTGNNRDKTDSNIQRKVVGWAYSEMDWDSIVDKLLPRFDHFNGGIIAVLTSSCGVAVTYEIDASGATLIGIGDWHNDDFNHLQQVIPFDSAWIGGHPIIHEDLGVLHVQQQQQEVDANQVDDGPDDNNDNNNNNSSSSNNSSSNNNNINNETDSATALKDVNSTLTCQAKENYSLQYIAWNNQHCPYVLYLYPSDKLYENHVGPSPFYLATFMLICFSSLSVACFRYDERIQSLLQRMIQTGRENRALVQQLFPNNVRHGLFVTHIQNTHRAKLAHPEGADPEFEAEFDDDDDDENGGGARHGNPVIIPEVDPTILDGVEDDVTVLTRRRSLGNESQAGDNSVGAARSVTFKSTMRLKRAMQGASLMEGDMLQPKKVQSRSIADSFSNCTVMFAYLVGFSAWSSGREPEHVFILLENIFKTMDYLAKRRNVFKVETIGDSYLAVTGLPRAQPDHAARMAKFSHSCKVKLEAIIAQLETTLGPGTNELQMKFGLHSGPVTAGLLACDKSRFQLFGDTVNTASRMASNSKKNEIQVSHQTAQLLVHSGKDKWIVPRTDRVKAKGKGMVQTYWLTAPSSINTYGGDLVSTTLFNSTDPKNDKKRNNKKSLQQTTHWTERDKFGFGLSETVEFWGDYTHIAGNNAPLHRQTSPSNARLVEWVSEVLYAYLRNIPHERSIIAKYGRRPYSSAVSLNGSDTSSIGGFSTDDEQSIVSIRSIDPLSKLKRLERRQKERQERRQRRNERKQKDDSPLIQLDPKIKLQLKAYVKKISEMYQEHPFHNFEHACHVTMSAAKLVKRASAADGNEDRQQTVLESLYAPSHASAAGDASEAYESESPLDAVLQFSIVFSALVHDVDHQGVSNARLSREKPAKSALFQHKSLAERHSINVSLDLLADPKFSALRECIYPNEEEKRRFCFLVEHVILATDVATGKGPRPFRSRAWDAVFEHEPVNLSAIIDGGLDVDFQTSNLLTYIIRASDYAYAMQHWDIYMKWNERLFREMLEAYDSGRAGKEPSSDWFEKELSFFDTFLIPLLQKMKETHIFGVFTDECLVYAHNNRAEWEAKGSSIVQEMVYNYMKEKDLL